MSCHNFTFSIHFLWEGVLLGCPIPITGSKGHFTTLQSIKYKWVGHPKHFENGFSKWVICDLIIFPFQTLLIQTITMVYKTQGSNRVKEIMPAYPTHFFQQKSTLPFLSHNVPANEFWNPTALISITLPFWPVNWRFVICSHTWIEIRLNPAWLYLESQGATRTLYVRTSKSS